MSARMRSRPKQTTAWYRGVPYTLDLVRCRRTASRFFSARPTSQATGR
jgi:hypothetical protein